MQTLVCTPFPLKEAVVILLKLYKDSPHIFIAFYTLFYNSEIISVFYPSLHELTQ